MRKAITIFATKVCNLSCHYCAAGCGYFDSDILTEPEFDSVVRWLEMYAPDADVHISGGEPLTRDIRSLVRALHRNGHRISIFTNGLLVNRNLWLLDFPVVFHVTHHKTQGVDYDVFFKCIEAIPKDRLVVARVYDGKEAFEEKEEVEKKYSRRGYKLQWMNIGGVYHGYGHDITHSPENTIALIGQNGDVYRCSNPKKGILGNIYKMTFSGWPENRECNLNSRNCNALLSAKMLGGIHDNFH